MPGAPHDGGEDSSGGVVRSESGLAHYGAIVDDEGSDFFVTHFGWAGICNRTQRLGTIVSGGKVESLT